MATVELSCLLSLIFKQGSFGFHANALTDAFYFISISFHFFHFIP